MWKTLEAAPTVLISVADRAGFKDAAAARQQLRRLREGKSSPSGA